MFGHVADWARQTALGDVGSQPGGRAVVYGEPLFLRAYTWKHIDIERDSVQARWQHQGDWQTLTLETETLAGHPANHARGENTIVSGMVVTLQGKCFGSRVDVDEEGGVHASLPVVPRKVSQTFVIMKECLVIEGKPHLSIGEPVYGGDLVSFRSCALHECYLGLDDEGVVAVYPPQLRVQPNQRFRLELKYAIQISSIASPLRVHGASSSSEAQPALTAEAHECAICCCNLDKNDAAMRCAGEGGQHHYYHTACLRDWISSCHTQNRTPDCPICRGGIQAHQGRLQALLHDPSTTADDRILLEGAVDANSNGWSDFKISPEVRHGLAMVAVAGLGALQGAFGGRVSFRCPVSDDERGHINTAHAVGVGLGVAFQIARMVARR